MVRHFELLVELLVGRNGGWEDAQVILIDATSSVPPFEQVRAQLAHQIASGTLVVGTRLPSVRQLAADLGLAPNTVARSYRDLEAAGLVETRGRAGTVVSAAGDQARAQLQAAAQHYAKLARDLGIGPAEAARFIDAALTSKRRGV